MNFANGEKGRNGYIKYRPKASDLASLSAFEKLELIYYGTGIVPRDVVAVETLGWYARAVLHPDPQIKRSLSRLLGQKFDAAFFGRMVAKEFENASSNRDGSWFSRIAKVINHRPSIDPRDKAVLLEVLRRELRGEALPTKAEMRKYLEEMFGAEFDRKEALKRYLSRTQLDRIYRRLGLDLPSGKPGRRPAVQT